MSTYKASRTVQITEKGHATSSLRVHEMGSDGLPVCSVGRRWTKAELLLPFGSRNGKPAVPCQFTPQGKGTVTCGLCALRDRRQA